MEERNSIIWPRLTIHKRDDKHRHSLCPHYGECLEEAAEKHWPSFSCYYCPYNPLGKGKGESHEKRN